MSVSLSRDGAVGIITLDRPPANSYDKGFLDELDSAIDEARFDPGVKAILVRSASDRFFSAGADVSVFAKSDLDTQNAFVVCANEAMSKFESVPKVVVAAINGHCLGGGLEIALCCDFRIAAEGSYKIGLPEVTLGLLPGTGGTQRLARLVGKARALELIATGRSFAFDEALEIGLVTKILEGPDFWPSALAYARQFLPPNKAAKAVGHIKRSIQSGMEMDLYDGLALEQELQIQLFKSEDAREGLDSWVDKRVPRFKGK